MAKNRGYLLKRSKPKLPKKYCKVAGGGKEETRKKNKKANHLA